MTDLIDRKALLEAIASLGTINTRGSDSDYLYADDVIETVNNQPAHTAETEARVKELETIKQAKEQ